MKHVYSLWFKNALSAPDRSLMEDIIQEEAQLLRITSLSDSERLHFLEDWVIRSINQASVVQKTLDEEKHLELLRWISTTPFSRYHESLSQARMPNSATWLLQHPEYRAWNNSSSSSILLLHGIPGSGKSNICSAVVDSHLAASQQAGATAAPMAYYYCASCDFEPERSQPDDVMRSILRQLTVSTTTNQRKVRDILMSEFDRKQAQSRLKGFDMDKPTIEDCIRLILEVAITDPISIVVDGLDMIEEVHRPKLINALVNIVQKSSSVVKIFLSSRYNGHVISLLEDARSGSRPLSTQQVASTPVTLIEINR